MSSQPTQRVRRNASPSTKQGPMKATMQFGLVPRQGSPSRTSRKGSPSSSPITVWAPEGHRIKTRRSPDNRASPERRSPSSPLAHRVERPKPVRPSPNPIRRTSSLDTIAGQYLTGQWPKDAVSPSVYTNDRGLTVTDKFTQTSDDFFSDSKSKKQQQQQQQHIRSASLGNGDNLKELYKQRMNRAKEGSKEQESRKLRQSPIHGNHLAIGTTGTTPSSLPIKIPNHIPKGITRARSSVEGLNQEIERLVFKNVSGTDDDEKSQGECPDGHRAPIAELIGTATRRSVDTQTPASNDDYSRTPVEDNSSGSGSRSQSISPSFPIIPGNMDSSRPSSRSDSSDSTSKDVEIKIEKDAETSMSPDYPLMSKYSASPKPNKSYDFVRGPPDGCERAKVIDEPSLKNRPMLKESLMITITPSSNQFKLSERSAFHPMAQYQCITTTTPAIRSPAPTAGFTSIESQ